MEGPILPERPVSVPTDEQAASLIRFHLQNTRISTYERLRLARFADHLDERSQECAVAAEPSPPARELDVRPRTADDAAAQCTRILLVARELASEHRKGLIECGFSEDAADHVASGALFDIQSQILGQLWREEP